MNFYLIITIISTLILCIFSIFSILTIGMAIADENNRSGSHEDVVKTIKVMLIILACCIINIITLWILYNGVKL